MSRLAASEQRTGWLMAAPFAIGSLLFLTVPVVLTLYTSFTDYALIEPPVWIGGSNYVELSSDPVFWISVKNTVLYAVIAVLLNTLVSLGLALLLEQRLRGTELVRSLVFAPVLVPIVAASLGWMWLYHAEHGLFNRMLQSVGLGSVDWLGDKRFALMSLILMGAWIVGSQVLVLTAALRGVRRELLDAASLDGAGPWWRFRAVTLPAIGPALLFNVIVSMIWAAQVFATPLVMTGGGPEQSTQVFSMYVFQNAFRYGRMGYASALAWLQFAVTFVLALGVLYVSARFLGQGRSSAEQS